VGRVELSRTRAVVLDRYYYDQVAFYFIQDTSSGPMVLEGSQEPMVWKPKPEAFSFESATPTFALQPGMDRILLDELRKTLEGSTPPDAYLRKVLDKEQDRVDKMLDSFIARNTRR